MNPLDKPYRLDRRGFKPTGNGTKGKCPHCGKAISHGLPGNPYARKLQPCQRVEIAIDRARRLREIADQKLKPALPAQHTLDGLLDMGGSEA